MSRLDRVSNFSTTQPGSGDRPKGNKSEKQQLDFLLPPRGVVRFGLVESHPILMRFNISNISKKNNFPCVHKKYQDRRQRRTYNVYPCIATRNEKDKKGWVYYEGSNSARGGSKLKGS